jgi:hypothetical protein
MDNEKNNWIVKLPQIACIKYSGVQGFIAQLHTNSITQQSFIQ